jgi:hypothetical protein
VLELGKPRKPSGWGCGAETTALWMRAHFTLCAKRPAASDHVDRRARTRRFSVPAHRDRECFAAWSCGTRLTASHANAFQRLLRAPTA